MKAPDLFFAQRDFGRVISNPHDCKRGRGGVGGGGGCAAQEGEGGKGVVLRRARGGGGCDPFPGTSLLLLMVSMRGGAQEGKSLH